MHLNDHTDLSCNRCFLISRMNRRKLRWKSVSTEEFVKLYLQQEGLWNINHEDYKCHWKRIVAYKEIINGMEKHVGSIDVNDVRTKIKNLRCTYIQELSKIMNHSSDPDNAYEPKITWFAEMDKCLNNIILKRNPAVGLNLHSIKAY